MGRSRCFAGVVPLAGVVPPFLFLMLFFTAEVEGAIYKWIDENGGVFFADEKNKVPEKYQGQIREIAPSGDRTRRKDRNPSRDEQFVRPPLRSSMYEQKTDAQGKEKKWWRDLVGQWETKKKNAEERIEALKLEQRQLQFHQMMPEKKRSKETLRIQKLIQAAIMRRDVAIRMLIEGLPDEARKAGAPIEWLSKQTE